MKDKKIEELEAQLQECSLRTDEHENVLNDHQQYSRMCSVCIQHPEWAENEAEDCTALVCDYAKTNNIDLSPADIDACYRVGKKTNSTRPILVKLVRRSHRTELLKTRTTQRLAKSEIYINEDLTTQRAMAAKIARKLVADKKLLKSYVYSGKVHIETIDKQHLSITNIKQLAKYQ